MKRRFRLRWLLKWTGTVACALIVSALIAGRWRHAWYDLDRGAHLIQLDVESGVLTFGGYDLQQSAAHWGHATPRRALGLHFAPNDLLHRRLHRWPRSGPLIGGSEVWGREW